MRIDVHAHYWADEYIALMRRLGRRTSQVERSPAGRLPLDERVGLLDAVGIDMQVLSVAQNQPYLASQDDAVAAARLANDLYADASQTYPRRFAAFATLPLPHVDATLAEIERSLDTLGMVGVTIGCSVAGRGLDAPLLEPVFAELDRRGSVVFLHPVGSGVLEGELTTGLAWIMGAPIEDTVATFRLVVSGVTTRFPRVQFIVPHLGGILPFVLDRVENTVATQRASGTPVPFEGPVVDQLRKLWFDIVSGQPAALRCACELWGAQRLMLGTDFPYYTGTRLQRLVDGPAAIGLPADDVQAILGGTAQKLLRLPVSA
ncbi:MAG TPA: amidohydrolase family protein [Chloroflexota bacterium]